MNAVVDSLKMMASTAFWTIILALMLRSDWCMRTMTESAFRWRRQPVTPDAMEQAMLAAKVVLITGIVVTGALTVLGGIALVINVTTMLRGS